MTLPARTPRVAPDVFDRQYEASADPWGYRTSAYELAKYTATLAALPPRTFERALEVGCSIGVFTGLLAPRCTQLVAIDFAPRALALARAHLGELTNLDIRQASFPEQVPEGRWDLVVCSEVLYYLDPHSLAHATRWLKNQLDTGATVVAVSWRGRGTHEPLRGDEVHDMLALELTRWHTLDGRRREYRLDRFDGHAS